MTKKKSQMVRVEPEILVMLKALKLEGDECISDIIARLINVYAEKLQEEIQKQEENKG